MKKSSLKNEKKNNTTVLSLPRRRRSFELPQDRKLKYHKMSPNTAKSSEDFFESDDSSHGVGEPTTSHQERMATVQIIRDSIMAHDWDKASNLLFQTLNSVDVHFYIKDVGKRDRSGKNLLHIAVANRAPLDILQSIVSIGGRDMLFEKEKEKGYSPLMVATDNNSKSEVISWLVNMGEQKSVWQKNKFGFTTLHMACASGASLQTVREIVNVGGKGLVVDENDKGHTALHLACSTSNSRASLAIVKMLIDIGGVDLVKKEGVDRRNALHLSYINGAPIEVAQLLLSVGGTEMLFKRNKVGYNHLQLACFNQHFEAIKTFMRLGGRELILSCPDEMNPLIISCTHGTNLGVVKQMVSLGGKELVTKLNENGENVLHLICSSSTTPANVLSFLAQIGGEKMIFSKNGDGYNPLHLLCMGEGTIEMVEVLIGIAGKNLVMEKDSLHGFNALHILARNNPPIELVKLLLNESENEILMQEDDSGNNPLHLACNFLGVELINIFVQNSNLEVISSVNDQKRTPLDCLLKKERPSLNKMQPLQKKWFELDPTSSSVPTLTNANILIWARQLNESDLQRALGYGLLKSVMNKNFIKPVNIALLMADLYNQIGIVIVYSFLIHPTITGEATVHRLPRNVLLICFAWSAFREITEMFRVRTSLNYADLVQLVLIMWTVILFDGGGVSQTERAVYTLATGCSTLELLIILGNLSYPISVFINALLRIFWVLIPFLVSTFLIAISFAHMFYMWSISSLDSCPVEKIDDQNVTSVDWTCNLSSSYAQTFSILITSNWSFLDDEAEGFQTVISYAFAFIVGILLLNILIAIINNEYNTTERSGDVEYWRYRLNFEDETQRMYSNYRGIIKPLKYIVTDGLRILWEKEKISNLDSSKKGDHDNRQTPKPGIKRMASLRDYYFTKDLEESSDKIFNRISFNTYSSVEFNKLGVNERREFFEFWYDWNSSSSDPPPLKKRMWYFYNRAKWEEIIYPDQSFENVVMGIKYNAEGSGLVFVSVRLLSYLVMLVNIVLIVGLFLLGLATFGICWPNNLKKRLFYGPTETKSNQLSEIKSEVDTKIAAIQEQVADVRASVEKISNTQEELIKALLTNQAQVSELITLLKTP
eukprot:CAMPEP_0203672164 /NCGR_PEP_ID=MMETSP0090-20130426/7743_1 /ASSEMBLY_ACC=CAM_ASM_001088 /TAXON_ID=426623 /ORGANISM="Chaetoceros affinis, Strain CCMP159" /LENGTH=1111 /DNA_ID=CAMNT_0050537419 /DNA_START=102 /DNA_END=3437 /DNA_ORIENTATION=+